MKSPLYSYPMRGFGMVAIYLVLGPAIMTITAAYLGHAWQGGADTLLEIVDVFQNEARPRLLSGYSYYMPSIFLSGIFCSFPASRGIGLSLKTTIWRSIFMIVIVEFFLRYMTISHESTILNEQNLHFIFFTAIQALAVAWFCWILASGFRLDKNVSTP